MTLPTPDHCDISYGPHPRNQLDVWMANADHPTPLAVYIHGGGWKGGDKSQEIRAPHTAPAVAKLLANGISVAAINYRYTSSSHPVPSAQLDAVRAVQFLRHHANRWNVDPHKFAAFGVSAGGCSTLFMAFHQDFANPESQDPVEQETARLLCAATLNAQCSIYPPHLEAWAGPKALEHRMIAQAFGETSFDDAHREEHLSTCLDYSPITHLDSSAPPVYLMYSSDDLTVPSSEIGHAIHHPVYGIKLHEAMQQQQTECWLQIGEDGQSDHPQYHNYADFLIDKLRHSAPPPTDGANTHSH